MKRLLVFRLSALGDVIHTLPAVAALRDRLPGTRIGWVVEAPYRELVELVGGVEAIPVRLKKWSKALLASRRDIGDAMRAMRGADAAVDFQGLIKSAVLMRLSGAPIRYGFDRDAIRERPAGWFANRHVAIDATHIIDRNLQLAGAIAPGAAAGTLRWDAFVDDSGLDDARGSVVLLPGAGKPNKLWPVERFRELAKNIGPAAMSVWGPGERELAEAIGARVAPPTDLRQLAGLLRNARVVIGADTGPLHLAAALGTPVIGLYGPTNPRRNGPYGQLDHCISSFETTKLIDSITVEDVMTMLDRVSDKVIRK
jgi:heptosyltransferase-1